jgi:hypothetical protein
MSTQKKENETQLLLAQFRTVWQPVFYALLTDGFNFGTLKSKLSQNTSLYVIWSRFSEDNVLFFNSDID